MSLRMLEAILSLSLNYHLVPNIFVASLVLGYAIPGTRHDTYADPCL
jgi:hypothetical protein